MPFLHPEKGIILRITVMSFSSRSNGYDSFRFFKFANFIKFLAVVRSFVQAILIGKYGMLRHSLATLKGKEEFSVFYGALLPL